MELKIDFTDKEITPWGGISLMQQFLRKLKMVEVFQRLPLPEQGSNRGYSSHQLLLHF